MDAILDLHPITPSREAVTGQRSSRRRHVLPCAPSVRYSFKAPGRVFGIMRITLANSVGDGLAGTPPTGELYFIDPLCFEATLILLDESSAPLRHPSNGPVLKPPIP